MPLTLIPNWANLCGSTCISSKFDHPHWFQIWPIVCGSTCISSKFDHQHCHKNWFQIWPTCNAIRIGSNFGHQMALLCHQVAPRALPHCIALIALLTLSVGIESLSSSARVTSAKSAKGGSLSFRGSNP